MVSTIESVLRRYHLDISLEMKRIVSHVSVGGDTVATGELGSFYGQMCYHLGWMDQNLIPSDGNPGKLLRPTLLLLAYEVSGAWEGKTEVSGFKYIRRALPAAAAIEFAHNFTLLHDDIEDGDPERRHRPTVWKLWGVPQAINTGDGLFALARLALWDILKEQVAPEIAVHLGAIFDRTLLLLTEGQHMDISFEQLQQISLERYLEMIGRKTATLMQCAAEMGARLGTQDEDVIAHIRRFGWALGLAFQIRDDILGIWAMHTETGKLQAGDIYRRKQSLPIVHAFASANENDRALLRSIYSQAEPLTPGQIGQVLTMLEHTGTRAYCNTFLAKYCQQAREALAAVPESGEDMAMRARKELSTLVDFLEVTTQSKPH